MNKEWDNPNKEQELIERKRKRSKERKAEGKSPTDAPFSQSVRPGLAIKGAKENRWFQEWSEKWGKEAFRVLKPGGYMLVCCATRMYHRMTCGIEDAGFEIRDTIMWLYGSGFPKSLNIGKQIDKIQGNEREVVGTKKGQGNIPNDRGKWGLKPNEDVIVDKGTSEWEGWGTALKPACEPIVVARKPLSEKNVALNVLKHGTGGINIDACRIGFQNKEDEFESKNKNQHSKYPKSIMRNPAKHGIYHEDKRPPVDYNAQGRFPANIILDEEAGKLLPEDENEYRDDSTQQQTLSGNAISNPRNKSASRFFYCAKASKSERNFGCDGLEEKPRAEIDKMMGVTPMLTGSGNPRTTTFKNNHPTVKPIMLMEYLIKLVSREGAIVLDPFLGSGTTAIACLKLNRKFIGIEKEEEYIKIANARIKPFIEQTKL